MVAGKVDAEFHADVGPATVNTSSTINFTAQKLISFDGLKFAQEPATVSTQSSYFISYAILIAIVLYSTVAMNYPLQSGLVSQQPFESLTKTIAGQ